MSLHQCFFAAKPALDTHWAIRCWSRRTLALLPLLLPLTTGLTTGCTIEQIAAPTQTPVVPAQAAEQSPTTGSAADAALAKEINPALSEQGLNGTSADDPAPSSVPQTPQLMSQASSTAAKKSSPVTEQGFNQGPLRVGNQTPHPLRIAFLAQGQTPEDLLSVAEATDTGAAEAGIAEPEASSADAEAATAIQEPFHWDFAPNEGGRDGLLLALAEQDLVLQNGDVVVAFAQDGSQRYWGPYVVGQTQLPHWNGDREEWQLLVQP